MKIKRGSTSVRRLIFVGDSSVTTGAGLANLAHNTANLVAYYFAGDLSNEVQITLATATLGSYTSGGFVAVDNTNMPGWYEIGIPDAALDGGNEVAIQLRGAANMVPVNLHIQLDAFDYQVATQPVNVTQFGGTNGTFSGGRPEVNTTHLAGQSVTAASGVTFPASVASPTNITSATGVVLSATTHTGAVIPTVTTLTNLPSIPANWLTSAGIASGALDDKGNWLKPTVAGRTLDVSTGGEAGIDWANVGSPTTTVDLTGTTISTSQAVASVSGSVGSVTAAITLPTIPADWITSSGLAGSAVTEIQSGLLTATAFNTAIGELPASVADAVMEDVYGDHTTPGTVGYGIGVLVSTIGTTGAGLTDIPWNPDWDAEVQSECADAITAASLATAVDLATVDTVVDAIKLKTDNLPSDPADQSAVEAAIIAATSGLATASSIVSLTTKVDTLDDYVDTEVAEIKAKTDNLPADPADASDIAASFVTVNSKLDAIDDYVDSEVAAIKVVTDRLSGMLVQDGLVYQYTTNALENGPASGGIGTAVAVYPLNASQPARVYDTDLILYKNETGVVVGPIAITSRNGNTITAVSLVGRTLEVRFVDYEGTELLTVDNGDIDVTGDDDNQISFPVTSDLTGSVTEDHKDQWHIWTLRDITSGDNVIAAGKVRVLMS